MFSFVNNKSFYLVGRLVRRRPYKDSTYFYSSPESDGLKATWQHGHRQNAMNDKQTGDHLFSKCFPTSRRYNIFHSGPLSQHIKCLNRAMTSGVYGSKKLRAMICANVVTADLETSFMSYCAFIFFSILYTITVGHH